MTGSAMAHRCAVLEGLWETWAAVGDTLTETDWTRETRLPGWDVAALYAHHSSWPAALQALATTSSADPTPRWRSAADLLRSLNAEGGIAHTAARAIADHAVADAEATSRDVLISRFRSQGLDAISVIRGREGTDVIDYFTLGSFFLSEALRIGILEATVHLLDLNQAIGRSPDISRDALEETSGLLAAAADPVTFIESATGRSTESVLPVLR